MDYQVTFDFKVSDTITREQAERELHDWVQARLVAIRQASQIYRVTGTNVSRVVDA